METAILGLISSVIVGVLSLIGVIYTNSQSNKKVEQQILTAQAVTDTKIRNLTDEVKKHNDFASRIPVIEEQIKVMNHRIDDLEDK
jgi:Tfp pilus assembly protein PilV